MRVYHYGFFFYVSNFILQLTIIKWLFQIQLKVGLRGSITIGFIAGLIKSVFCPKVSIGLLPRLFDSCLCRENSIFVRFEFVTINRIDCCENILYN